MEWESLDLGITIVLEALDNTMGTLHDVIIPSSRVLLGLASYLLLPLYIFYFLTILSL
jgi:hypothetical protein